MKLGKMNIHKRILVMLLSVGLLTFAALGLVSLRGLFGVRQQTEEGSERLGNAVADFAGDLAVAQTKKQIGEAAAEKARQVERELTMVREDTTRIRNASYSRWNTSKSPSLNPVQPRHTRYSPSFRSIRCVKEMTRMSPAFTVPVS